MRTREEVDTGVPQALLYGKPQGQSADQILSIPTKVGAQAGLVGKAQGSQQHPRQTPHVGCPTFLLPAPLSRTSLCLLLIYCSFTHVNRTPKMPLE